MRREALVGLLLAFLGCVPWPAHAAPLEEVNVLLTEAERLSALPEPRLQEALSKLDSALALVDSSSEDACPILNRRARVLIDLGRFQEAEQDGMKSLALKPSALAWLRVAMARLYADTLPAAAEAAARSAELYRAAPESRRELALAYEVSGCARWRQKDPAAGEDFRLAEEIDPKRRGLLAEWKEDRLFCCLPDRDARRVGALVDEALRLLRAQDRSREEVRADRELAAQKLGEALPLVGGRLEAHHLLNLRARLFNLLGQPVKAYADAAESLRIKPKANPAACLEAALASHKSDLETSLRNALNGLEQARDWDSPSKPGVLARLYRVSGCARLKMGKPQEARADFVQMAAQDPKAAAALQEFDKGNSPCEERSEDEALDLSVFYLPLGVLAALGFAAGAWALYRRRRKDEPAGAALAVRPSAETGAGRLAGKYEIVRVIGKGGMGAVYEATDHSLGRTVAIKKMAAQLAQMGPEGRKYFLKEAHNVAALRHSAIVDIYAVLEDGDDVYLVFELVRGKTVQHILAEQKRIPLVRACEILRPVCQALHYAHGKQMIHRDLKPANIMVTDDGRIKLMDFGIARSVQDGVVQAAPGPVQAAGPADLGRYARTVNVTGTPPYMSPEAQQGIVCQEGDVYALGVVLYEMLTGALPFEGADDFQQKLFMKFAPATTRVPGLPRQVDELLHSALQPEPSKRLRTAAEFLARLEAAASAAGRT